MTATDTFFRRYNRIVPLRPEVLTLRSRKEHMLLTAADHKRFVGASQDAFLKEASTMLQSEPSPRSIEHLQRLHAQVQQDHERQTQDAQERLDLEAELGEKEYDLQRLEHSLAQAARQMADVVKQVNLPEQTETRPETEPSEAPAEQMPQLVQIYFDKVGEASVLRDRLIELSFNQRDARTRRIFQADQDQPLQTTDEEFEESNQREYAEAEKELEAALEKVEFARKLCVADDFDPELYRKPQSVSGHVDASSISDVPVEPNTPNPELEDAIGAAQTPPEFGHIDPTAPVISVPGSGFDPSFATWVKKQKNSPQPLDERVVTWMQSVPRVATYSKRSRSLSEPRRRASATNGAVQPMMSQYTQFLKPPKANISSIDEANEYVNLPYNALLLQRRRSSDPQVTILPPQQTSRQRIFDQLRKSAP